MPALLMHHRGAERLLGDLPPPLDRAAKEALWSYRLGSVLVDLPLFDGFWSKVALFLAGRPYPESRWGTVLHRRGCASLASALLRRARGEHRDELLALVAGLLTHIALDRAMHPPIEEAVSVHLRPDETPSQLHEALENYQSLRWHREHLGCDGLGTSLLKGGVSVSPEGGSRMPRWLRAAFAESLSDVYEAAPSRREISRWVRGICGYRDLLSTPFARLSVRSSERFGEHRPWAASVELEPGFEEGLALAMRYSTVAARALDTGDEGFVETIGDGPLV